MVSAAGIARDSGVYKELVQPDLKDIPVKKKKVRQILYTKLRLPVDPDIRARCAHELGEQLSYGPGACHLRRRISVALEDPHIDSGA